MQDLRQNPLSNNRTVEPAVPVVPMSAAPHRPPDLAVSEIDPFAYYGWQEPQTETPKVSAQDLMEHQRRLTAEYQGKH
jgi:hypothetical protein